MKKVKLFTTIASLCLAVALMAFGVYAAGTQNVKVSANVSYEIGNHVAGTLTVTAYDKLDTATAALTDVVDTKTATFKSEDADVNKTGANGLLTFEKTLKTTTDDQYVAFKVAFAASNGKAVTITLTGTSSTSFTAQKPTNVTVAATSAEATIYFQYTGAGNADVESEEISFDIVINVPTGENA